MSHTWSLYDICQFFPPNKILFAQIWFLTADSLDTARPEWEPGQVTIDTNRDFRLYLEGKASNGGFAIDQLTFYPGDCPSKFKPNFQY